MKTLVVAIALTLSIPTLARAQEPATFEAFGGYSFLRADGVRWPLGDFVAVDPITTDQHGWEGSFAWNVTNHFAIEGDVSGHYKGEGGYTRELSTSPPTSFLAVVESRTRTHMFMGGPKAFARVGRVTPFAHALFGAVRREETRAYGVRVSNFPCQGIQCDIGVNPFTRMLAENSFSIALGGGLDVRLTDRIAVRVVQADYFRTRFRDETQNDLRVSTGVVFRFGSR